MDKLEQLLGPSAELFFAIVGLVMLIMWALIPLFLYRIMQAAEKIAAAVPTIQNAMLKTQQHAHESAEAMQRITAKKQP